MRRVINPRPSPAAEKCHHDFMLTKDFQHSLRSAKNRQLPPATHLRFQLSWFAEFVLKNYFLLLHSLLCFNGKTPARSPITFTSSVFAGNTIFALLTSEFSVTFNCFNN